jgi:hypothetical protein
VEKTLQICPKTDKYTVKEESDKSMILEPSKSSSPKNKDIQTESGSFILVESLLDHTAEPIINLPSWA